MAGLYVYAVVAADAPLDLNGLPGMGGASANAPRRVGRADLPVAAVVSDAVTDLRGKRRDLLAHAEVLARIADQSALLPMRFGVVASDEQDLLEDLSRNADRYRDRIGAVAGRVEFNVKAIADTDAMVAAVAQDPKIRSARDSARRQNTPHSNLVLGQQVATAVARRRQAHAEQLYDRLRRLAMKAAAIETNDRYVLNASFLVQRTDVASFIAAADELHGRMAPDVELVTTGPLPPYSFMDG